MRWKMYEVLKKEDGLTAYQIYDKLKDAKFNSASLCLQKIVQCARSKAFTIKMEGKTRKYYVNEECAEQYFKDNGIFELAEIRKIMGQKNGRKNLGKKKQKNRVETFGKPENKHFELGSINNHFFIIEKTKYTSTSIKKYHYLKDKVNFNKIINELLYKN